MKPNSFDISQIRLICNKNPGNRPRNTGEVCLWICAWKVKHTRAFSLPLGVHIGILSDQNKALASSANILFHPAPRSLIATTTRCGEERACFLFSLNSLGSHMLSQACIMNAHAHSPLRTITFKWSISLSLELTESPRATREAQWGVWGNCSEGSALLFKRWPSSRESNRPGRWNYVLGPPIPQVLPHSSSMCVRLNVLARALS